MVPHVSGTSLDAQIRYANGTKDILERYLTGKEQDAANVIVSDGEYMSLAYGQRAKKSEKVVERKQEVRTAGKGP